MQFEERRRIATRPLGGNDVRIGRDPTRDLIVDYANVSRHHAVVRELGDRNVVLDLGSTNGVRVNGTPIGGKPHLLAQGDLRVTAVAMLILLAASVGLYLSMGSDAPETAPATNPNSLRETSSISYGPIRTQAGTHLGMPPPSVPQRSGSKADSRVPPGGWYALARPRSSGDPSRDERSPARRGADG